eukprot:CAMPEP_0195071626 /NCGR_PEP_ID=MMETSP0448-20130528/15385_1 /TAXON_ID=66468 /ORGANISM="Heterocapsa triquestra, Strain CCMP 448" /LENGTH=65 /DNA_ID=CAMNT_0040103505 /DNA_START=18 /DNA_END=211 /DNA_ORIENTATION=+
MEEARRWEARSARLESELAQLQGESSRQLEAESVRLQDAHAVELTRLQEAAKRAMEEARRWEARS